MDLENEWDIREGRMLDLYLNSLIDIVESEEIMEDGAIFNGGKNE